MNDASDHSEDEAITEVGDVADDGLSSRRSAIKKAAAGAAVVGAAWAAPKVEGLSVVPDYAAAATLPGGVGVTLPSIDVKIPFFGSTDYWNDPSSNPRSVSANVPGGGSVTVTLPGGATADEGANVPFTVSFAGWDPPFNRFTGGNLVFRGRNSGPTGPRNGPHGPLPIGPWRTGGSLPSPTESTVTFNIPSAVNDVGPSPVANTQWGDLRFTFDFGPA